MTDFFILSLCRVTESPVNENDHYYPHATKVECSSDSPPMPSNAEYLKRHQDSPPEHHNGGPPVKKGRGRPKKICDGVEIKEWSDDEIYKLIELWGKHDILYNCKHPLYHNKAEKTKSMEMLRERLDEAGVSATTRQIFDKLTTLRNYYGAVKRKSESLKRQGFEGEDAYFCRWQFYQPLSFLEGTFSPRHSELHYKKLPYIMDNGSMMTSERSLPSLLSVSNQQVRPPVSREIFDRPKEAIPPNPNHMSRHQHSRSSPPTHMHLLGHPPNPPTNHSMEHTEKPNHGASSQSQVISSSTVHSAHVPTGHPDATQHPRHPGQPTNHSPRSNPPSGAATRSPTHPHAHAQQHHKHTNTILRDGVEKTEDQLFGEIVAKMISGIIDSEEKALLLIRIQQDIVQTKFRIKSAFQKPPRVHSTTPNWNGIHIINPPLKDTNNAHEYYTEQKQYRSLEHSPLSSRSDSPLSSPACPPKLDIGS